MESLVYFILIAVFIVAILLLASLLVAAVGVVALIIVIVRGIVTGKRAPGCVVAGLVTMIAVGGLTFWGVASWTSATVHSIEQDIAESQRRYAGSVCLELSLTEDYRLQITRFRDGTHSATLERSDGSQCYIHGITRYAIVDGYMVGKVAPEGPTLYWFWFDLTGQGPGHYFENRSEFDNVLQELGLTEEPTLLPISNHCELQGCEPCSIPTPAQGSEGMP